MLKTLKELMKSKIKMYESLIEAAPNATEVNKLVAKIEECQEWIELLSNVTK